MPGWGYDVVGALDATPGTEELRAVAARVERVDTGALADLARRYASLADGMDTSLQAVADRGEGVGRAWQGPGADAFARYAADFARAGSGTGDAARRVQGELAGLGRTLAALREEVAGHVSDALDLARARPEQVRTAVATPTARAQAALDRAEQEVADCARRLRDISDGFTGFSRLRSPDAGVMSASSGATSRWTDRQGAVVGADEPVRDARIPDGGSGGSGGDSGGFGAGGGRGGDDGSGSVTGSEGAGGSDADDGRRTGDDGTGSADRSDGSSTDGDRGSRADAADPGNTGRYETGSDGTGSDVDAGTAADDDGSGRGGDADGHDSDEADGEVADDEDAGDEKAGDEKAGDEADEKADADDPQAGEDAKAGDDAQAGDNEADAGDKDADDPRAGDEADADDKDGDDPQADKAGDDDKADDEKAGDAKDSDDAEDSPTPGTTGAEPETGTDPSSGKGGVQDWIRQATAILAENGVDPDKMRAADIATIIEHESGGDPDAVNNWDSNADKGTPSKGLMQTIGPTFEANKLPGHDDITDPVDNIIAAVRYAIKRYGSVSEVPGVEAVARGDSYVGY